MTVARDSTDERALHLVGDRALFPGALVGPDDQGLIAYLAIREAGLAKFLPEGPYGAQVP